MFVDRTITSDIDCQAGRQVSSVSWIQGGLRGKPSCAVAQRSAGMDQSQADMCDLDVSAGTCP